MRAEARDTFDVTDQIAAFKRSLAPRHGELKRAYVDVKNRLIHDP